jgi:hypothetical protein
MGSWCTSPVEEWATATAEGRPDATLFGDTATLRLLTYAGTCSN